MPVTAVLKPPLPPEDIGDSGSTESTSQEAIQSSRPDTDTTSGGSSSSRRTDTYTYYSNNNNTIFLIYKTIESKENECILNDKINVTGRIICNPSGRMDNIFLKEELSPGCIVIENTSKYIVVNDPINNSINELNINNWNSFETTNSQSISTGISTIYPGSWIVYTYEIELKNVGWTNIDTIIKYCDNKKKSKIPDYAYSLNPIFVKKEKTPYFITLIKDRKIVSPDENINLLYEIEYAGENQAPSRIEVELDKNNLNIFNCSKNTYEPIDISYEKPAKFELIVNYSTPNVYAPPKLVIDGFLYDINSGDSEIDVQSWDKRYSEYIYWLLQVFGLVIAFALGYREFRNLEAEISRVRKEITKIRGVAEAYNLKYIKNNEEQDKIKKD